MFTLFSTPVEDRAPSVENFFYSLQASGANSFNPLPACCCCCSKNPSTMQIHTLNPSGWVCHVWAYGLHSVPSNPVPRQHLCSNCPPSRPLLLLPFHLLSNYFLSSFDLGEESIFDSQLRITNMKLWFRLHGYNSEMKQEYSNIPKRFVEKNQYQLKGFWISSIKCDRGNKGWLLGFQPEQTGVVAPNFAFLTPPTRTLVNLWLWPPCWFSTCRKGSMSDYNCDVDSLTAKQRATEANRTVISTTSSWSL